LTQKHSILNKKNVCLEFEGFIGKNIILV